MRNKVEVTCAWSGVAFIVLYGVFFAGVAHYIPPPAPDWSAERVGEWYGENTNAIRAGQLGAMAASFLLFPLWALITAHLARIEMARGRFPLLALIQFGNAVLLQVYFVLCSMIWIAATFRDELAPDTVRTLHDLGWLMFVMVAPGYLLQMICIGLAAFLDTDPDPVFPRWAGYFHLWVGVSGVGGALAVFFKDGPFAWNGLVAFYIPVAVFLAWLCIITALLHRRAARTPESAFALPVRERVPA